MFDPVVIEGLDELQEALRELPDATSRNVLRRVAKSVLEPIADRARQLVPVHDGRLRDSIVVSDKLSRRQKSQFQRDDPSDVVMFVGAGALPQAHMMEFGTIDVTPRPFLRPAWDGGQDTLINSLKDTLWEQIEKATLRAERKAAKIAAGG
jgi:HK97 gp10 family phage protein